MEFDEDFHQVQAYIKQLNPELVVIHSGIYENNALLIQQLVLQVKIYGSKIIELYQSLDEICPTDRKIEQLKADIKHNQSDSMLNQINYKEVWSALTQGFKNDVFKAIELLQQLDYSINITEDKLDQFAEYLQITNRYKDREIEKLCQLFQESYPQTYFQQIQHITNILQQYSQMVPQLVQENEELRQIAEKSVLLNQHYNNDKDVKSINILSQMDKKSEESISQQGEIYKLKQQLINIEKMMNEKQLDSGEQQELQKYEEQCRILKQKVQNQQIEIEELKFKNCTGLEENKNQAEQIQTLSGSYDKMQSEYKKVIIQKNQRICELEEQSTSRNVTDNELEQIQNKIKQYKQLYEQKIKQLQQCLQQSEQDNFRLKDVVRNSAQEVDNLRFQIEQVMNPKQSKKKGTIQCVQSNQPKTNSIEYYQLLQKYQELIERNECLNQQLFGQVLDGSLLSTNI